MARKSNRNRRYKLNSQGLLFKGKAPIIALDKGRFSYKGKLYYTQDFRRDLAGFYCVNLETTRVPARGLWAAKKKKKKKKKQKEPENFSAVVISNSEDCPDIDRILRYGQEA